jgi:hypothetical protein
MFYRGQDSGTPLPPIAPRGGRAAALSVGTRFTGAVAAPGAVRLLSASFQQVEKTRGPGWPSKPILGFEHCPQSLRSVWTARLLCEACSEAVRSPYPSPGQTGCWVRPCVEGKALTGKPLFLLVGRARVRAQRHRQGEAAGPRAKPAP